MIEWLSIGRLAGWLGWKGKQRARKWAGDRQARVDQTFGAVSPVKEFIRRANPIAVSIESWSGEIETRLGGFESDWKRLRPPLIEAVDKHPSEEVQRLGNDLAEDVEKLLMGLRFLASNLTDPDVKAAASQSVNQRRDHALELVDDLIKKVRAY